ncbi:hypothetical protein CEE39_03950 [bacterium (candidate division B38) B3_B38]|nr:MAG: hypothetical protein CEE39_03950 [bacterium (candidate division B38) B3_B38]
MEHNIKDEIDKIYEMEAQGYKETKQNLSYAIPLILDIFNLYDSLSTIQGFYPIDEKIDKELIAKQIAANQALLLYCKHRFIAACFATLRGHCSDSLIILRIAIEYCLVAYKIKRYPNLADVWREAYESGQPSNEYKKHFFNIRDLLPSSHPITDELYKRYKDCSTMAHANIISMAPKMENQIHEELCLLKIDYFEYQQLGFIKLTRCFFYIIDNQIGILQIFDEIFKEVIDYDRNKWLINLNQVNNKISIHFKK